MKLEVKWIYWIAAFLEGEGCFYLYRNCPYVSASQVQRWPLWKLKSFVGGPLHRRPVCRYRKRPIYEWKITGRKAASVMMMLYSLMSPKRKEKIKKALAVWRRTKARGMADINKAKTHCPQGHPYSKENTILTKKKNGWEIRTCKTCLRLKMRRYRDVSYWKNW